jgi:hypothetical protein
MSHKNEPASLSQHHTSGIKSIQSAVKVFSQANFQPSENHSLYDFSIAVSIAIKK